MGALGPVVLDLQGPVLAPEDRELLRHPMVGGVILFTRNFESPEQLRRLTADIRALRAPPLLVAVDHEGGRVQRFKQGFTLIPPMRLVGAIGEDDPSEALAAAEATGVILATELLANGVDFSFAPVLDIDFESSSVIGDRAFSGDAKEVSDLAAAFLDGMHRAGMAGVGKHFPGHGYTGADSHVKVPVDERELAEIEAVDLLPYRRLIPRGLEGVMPAHVIYPKVDSKPAGFSETWLKRVLRGALGFDGMIFSDDLSMEGASVAGSALERGRAALEAGCDMVLVCNSPRSVAELLQGLEAGPANTARVEKMRGRRRESPLAGDHDYHAAQEVFWRAFG